MIGERGVSPWCVGERFTIRLTPEMAAVIETPGAGGYGSPGERDEALLKADIESGKFSPEFIAANYGK